MAEGITAALIAAVAVLTFIFPWLVVPILIVSAAAFYRFRVRK